MLNVKGDPARRLSFQDDFCLICAYHRTQKQTWLQDTKKHISIVKGRGEGGGGGGIKTEKRYQILGVQQILEKLICNI